MLMRKLFCKIYLVRITVKGRLNLKCRSLEHCCRFPPFRVISINFAHKRNVYEKETFETCFLRDYWF